MDPVRRVGSRCSPKVPAVMDRRLGDGALGANSESVRVSLHAASVTDFPAIRASASGSMCRDVPQGPREEHSVAKEKPDEGVGER
jgi:hypothetical protein